MQFLHSPIKKPIRLDFLFKFKNMDSANAYFNGIPKHGHTPNSENINYAEDFVKAS